MSKYLLSKSLILKPIFPISDLWFHILISCYNRKYGGMFFAESEIWTFEDPLMLAIVRVNWMVSTN